MSEREYDDGQDVLLADARQEEFGQAMAPAVISANHLMTPRQVGDLFGTLTTAQPNVPARNVQELMGRLKAMAAAFGDTYEYAWDVKDKNSKRADKKTTISGPTIKLAMDLAREFGNCSVDVREIEGPTHWVFYARFTDLQTGYNLTRAFRQRKSGMQGGGMQADRALDMSYQMGQSKASRNVVVNALSNYVDYMRTEAARAAVGKITADPKKYLEGIDRGLEKLGISLARAEAMAGRVMAEWNPRDIAKVMNALKAINDGMVDARDAFPTTEAVVPKSQDDDEQDQQTAGGSESPGGADEGAAATSSEAESAGNAHELGSSKAPADEAEQKPAATRKADKPKASPTPSPAPAPAPASTPAPKAAAKKPAALF